MHQSQNLSLQQVLAPQLQQSLLILQAPLLELRNLVQQEMETNPVLEERVWFAFLVSPSARIDAGHTDGFSHGGELVFEGALVLGDLRLLRLDFFDERKQLLVLRIGRLSAAQANGAKKRKRRDESGSIHSSESLPGSRADSIPPEWRSLWSPKTDAARRENCLLLGVRTE